MIPTGAYRARWVRGITVHVKKASKTKVWFVANSGITWVYPISKFKLDFERMFK